MLTLPTGHRNRSEREAGSTTALSARPVNRADNAQQIVLTAVTFDQVRTASPKGSLPARTYVYWSKDDATPTHYPSLSAPTAAAGA